MKKIITLLLTICLFISNGTGGIYAYETKSIIENSTLEISHTLGKTKYKIYHTNKVIGSIPKNTIFILDPKGNVVTNENTIKKILTFHLVTSKDLRQQAIKQRDAYKT